MALFFMRANSKHITINSNATWRHELSENVNIARYEL